MIYALCFIVWFLSFAGCALLYRYAKEYIDTEMVKFFALIPVFNTVMCIMWLVVIACTFIGRSVIAKLYNKIFSE
jgi:hypothetical protein